MSENVYNARMVDWAVSQWHAQVFHRPLMNVHRRSLDDVWRQVIKHCGGDDITLIGPRHDELLADSQSVPAAANTESEEGHE